MGDSAGLALARRAEGAVAGGWMVMLSGAAADADAVAGWDSDEGEGKVVWGDEGDMGDERACWVYILSSQRVLLVTAVELGRGTVEDALSQSREV